LLHLYSFLTHYSVDVPHLHSFPTRRSSDLVSMAQMEMIESQVRDLGTGFMMIGGPRSFGAGGYLGTPIEKVLPVSLDVNQNQVRSEEHTSELQSLAYLVCRLLLEKKKKQNT